MKAFFIGIGSALYDRVWVHKRMTIYGILAAAASVVIDHLLATFMPQIPAGWSVYAAPALLALGAWLKGKLKEVSDAGGVTLGLALLLFAAPAQAQEQGAVLFCIDDVRCVRPVAGFSGTAFALEAGSPVRSVQISGLLELDVVPKAIGFAAGASFQAGDRLAVGATGLLTLPFAVPAGTKAIPALGLTASFLGETPVVNGVVGLVARF